MYKRQRFDRKDIKLWTIEGPRHIDRHSVISLNHYEKPKNMISLLNKADAKELNEKDDAVSDSKTDTNFRLM